MSKKLKLLIIGILSITQLASCNVSTIPTNYIVTFESNGGTHINTQKVISGETAQEPNPSPTKLDYTFGGWYIASDLSGEKYDFSTPVTNDITLYANWEGGPQPVIPTYTIDFQGTNCSSSLNPTTKYHTGDEVSFQLNIEDQTQYKFPKNINVSGVETYSYDKTTGQISFTIENNNVLVVANADIILPATKHTVTFILNGATSPLINPVSIDEGSLFPSDKIPANPTKPGYTFEGWSSNEKTKSIIDLSNTTINCDLILYAWWSNAQSVKITFDANGGYFDDNPSKTTTDVNTPYGQVPVAPTPKKVVTGQTTTFKGWNKSLEIATTETTYIAQWDDLVNKCHVTFDGNGGTITSGGEPRDVDYGGKIDTAPIVVRDGFGETTGWYDAPTGGNKFTFGTSTVTSNITLYAHWGSVQSIDITFNANGGYFDNDTSITSKTVTTTYGQVPVAPIPVKTVEGATSTFKGWNKTLEIATTETTYTAQWDDVVNKCHVTFNGNGGTITSGGEPRDIDYGGKIDTAPIVVREGFGETTGWYDAPTGGNKFTFGTSTVTGNITLYAHWGNVQSIDITFNANGGYFDNDTSITSKTIPTTYGQVPVAPIPVKTVGGATSTFKGWDKSLEPAKLESEGGLTTYTAQWDDEVNKCHVTFDGNGGTITSGGEPRDVDYGGKIDTAPIVVRGGFGETTGWYDAPTGGNKFIFGISTVTSNITLYAHWGSIQSIDITFNANGGYFDNDTSITSKTIPTTYGQVPVAPIPVKTVGGATSTFKGWDKSLEPAKLECDGGTTTYTAQWEDVINKYHVTFDANGGTITSGGEPLDVDYGYSISTAPIATKPGYQEPIGWYDAISGGNQFIFGTTKITNNLTLYAHWGNIKTYTIIFDANGGKYGSSDIITRENVKYATMPEIPDNPIRIDETGSKVYSFKGYDKNIIPPTGNELTITYKALWEETDNYHKITLKSSDGKFIDESTQKYILVENNYSLNKAISTIVKPEFIETNDKIVYKFNKWVYEDGSNIGLNDVVDNDVVIKATYAKKTLEECSWSEVSRISSKGADYARNYFGDVSNGTSIEKSIIVNGLVHKVRIIGYGFDVDSQGKSLGITFDFVNLISDSNGYSLATYWMDTSNDDASNHDYLNSTVYRALTNQGTSNLNWFRYYGIDEDGTDETKGTTSKNKHFTNDTGYVGKSVYDMLPLDLRNELKVVKKTIDIKNNDGSWSSQEFNDKLFLLSKEEIGNTLNGHEYERYEFYNTILSLLTKRRSKTQVIGGEGARTNYLSGRDIDGSCTVSKHVYAGYAKDNQCGVYWLRSPHISNNNMSYYIKDDGNVDFYLSAAYARGIAPAFCI